MLGAIPEHAPAQLGEAQDAAQQFQQDQHRPAVADDLQRLRHGSQTLVSRGFHIRYVFYVTVG